MGTKALLLVGCFLAFVLFISSEVAARDLAETNTVDTSTGAEAAVGDEKYSGGGNYNGGGGNYNGGGGRYNGGGGGRYNGGGGRHNGGGRGGYCRYGCCGGRYNRGGCRCCTFAGEKVDAATP